MNNKVYELYKAHCEWYQECVGSNENKYTWAADKIFGLTTYDDGLDEKFVSVINEILAVILAGKNFDYCVDRENYIQYILVCQLLNNLHWIEWGTSIRGAWFTEDVDSRNILDEEWWIQYNEDGCGEKHIIEAVPFTEANLITLIDFLAMYGEETED